MNEVHAARALGALSALGPRTELAAAQALSDLRRSLVAQKQSATGSRSAREAVQVTAAG
jgi:hypothetical protein